MVEQIKVNEGGKMPVEQKTVLFTHYAQLSHTYAHIPTWVMQRTDKTSLVSSTS